MWVSDVQVITDTAKRCESPPKNPQMSAGNSGQARLRLAHIFPLLCHRAYSSTDIMAGVINFFFLLLAKQTCNDGTQLIYCLTPVHSSSLPPPPPPSSHQIWGHSKEMCQTCVKAASHLNTNELHVHYEAREPCYEPCFVHQTGF